MVHILMILMFCRFFFFTQKTADEMRISDGSSDVCSSDLGFVLAIAEWNVCAVTSTTCGRVIAECIVFAVADRKSVVKGKSVSVGVDLGGRRIIKKKTQQLRHAVVHHQTSLTSSMPYR